MTSIIEDNNIIYTYKIVIYLLNIGKIEHFSDIEGKIQKMELVKNGKSYLGDMLFPAVS